MMPSVSNRLNVRQNHYWRYQLDLVMGFSRGERPRQSLR
jgi:hypothetical protein